MKNLAEALKDADLLAKIGQGRQARYSVSKEGDKVVIFSSDLNDKAELSIKDPQFAVKCRAIGYLIDQKLGLKGQHQSRLWSKVRRELGI